MLRVAETTRSVTELNPSTTTNGSGSGSDNTGNIDLRKIFEDLAVEPKDCFQYDYFLMFTKQKQASSAYLADILQKLRPLVHMLDPKLFEAGLVNMLFFDIKWSLHCRNEALLDSLAQFLTDLNSAYASYIYKCLNMLLKNFLTHDSSKWQSTRRPLSLSLCYFGDLDAEEHRTGLRSTHSQLVDSSAIEQQKLDRTKFDIHHTHLLISYFSISKSFVKTLI